MWFRSRSAISFIYYGIKRISLTAAITLALLISAASRVFTAFRDYEMQDIHMRF